MEKTTIELPDVVTKPTTGRYLLTPASWNSQEKQALYRIEDTMQLIGAISQVFDEPDKPKVVPVYAFEDGTFTIGFDDTLMIVDDEGFVKIAPSEMSEA